MTIPARVGSILRFEWLGATPTVRLILAPVMIAVFIAYYATILWTLTISFTSSSLLPQYDFVGLAQYTRLFGFLRWKVAFTNMFVFGIAFIFLTLIIGTILAIAIDSRVHAESAFRTVMLYPLSLSFIVVGLVWQWILDPGLGLQAAVRSLGFESFTFDWIARRDRVVYTLVIAAIWHSSGLIMAIILAGLRGIDREIWRAAKVEGIPTRRIYISIVLPMLRPMILTCVTLLAVAVVKNYELVVAMTRGGPGNSSDMPSRFVVENLFERSNIGLGSAAAVVMLVSILAALAPYLYLELRKRA
jgi:glucose/mannose transport system permease protein